MALKNYLEEQSIISPYNDSFIKSLSFSSPKLKSTNLSDYYNSSKMDYLNSLKSGNFNQRQIDPKINNTLMKAKEPALLKPTLDNNLKIKTPTKTTFLDKINSKNLNTIGQGIDIASSFLPEVNDNSITGGINQATDVASDVLLKSGNPYAMIGGAALKLSALGTKGLAALTGGRTTIEKPGTTGDAILSSNILGLTPISLINAWTKKKVEGSNVDLASDVASGGGYSPSDATKTAEFGGITSLFGGKKKRKNLERRTNKVNEENILKRFVQTGNNKQELASQNSTGNIFEKNQQQLQGGLDPRFLLAKKGTKLFELKNIKSKANKNVQMKKNGGSINLIVDGALHARKNNIDMEGITNKGVPVISKAEGGELSQHAEVEREELICNLNLTKFIENMLNKYKSINLSEEEKDNILINVGKRLTEEILENTIDNTELLDKI